MKHRRTTRPFILIGLLTLAACTFATGDMASETREVSGFDQVVLKTSGDVSVEVTGTESLEIRAQEDILDLLTSDVVDGRLELGSSGPFTTTRGITYTITVADLTGLSIEGSGNVEAKGIDSELLRASISGSGSIEPVGSSRDLEVTISGSGSFEGDDLEAVTGEVTVSGSGDATVNVSDALDVVISGSGDVRYTGSPSLSQQVSGSGDVSQR